MCVHVYLISLSLFLSLFLSTVINQEAEWQSIKDCTGRAQNSLLAVSGSATCEHPGLHSVFAVQTLSKTFSLSGPQIPNTPVPVVFRIQSQDQAVNRAQSAFKKKDTVSSPQAHMHVLFTLIHQLKGLNNTSKLVKSIGQIPGLLHTIVIHQ